MAVGAKVTVILCCSSQSAKLLEVPRVVSSGKSLLARAGSQRGSGHSAGVDCAQSIAYSAWVALRLASLPVRGV